MIVYHSNAKPPGAAGVGEIVGARRAGSRPSSTRTSKYFDPTSDPADPRWDWVTVAPRAQAAVRPPRRAADDARAGRRHACSRVATACRSSRSPTTSSTPSSAPAAPDRESGRPRLRAFDRRHELWPRRVTISRRPMLTSKSRPRRRAARHSPTGRYASTTTGLPVALLPPAGRCAHATCSVRRGVPHHVHRSRERRSYPRRRRDQRPDA